MRRLTATAILTLTLLAVTGCTAGGVVAFEREQTEADVPDIDFEVLNIERDSVRFMAEEAGVQYFVARSEEGTLCLVPIAQGQPEAAASYCADHGLGLQSGTGPKLELVVPDMGERPGWRKLAPNLYAED